MPSTTPQTKSLPPDVAVRGVSTGLFLMAFFTQAWAGMAQSGLQNRDYRVLLVIFGLISCNFLFFGVRLRKAASQFPPLQSEEAIAANRKAMRNFGIIFGLEGIGIPLVCALLSGFGYPQLMNCGIALVVGLHFYPLAKIFNRTIDYYLATWAAASALLVAFLLYTNAVSQRDGTAIVATALGLTTTAYGIYMIREGTGYLARLKSSVENPG